MWGSLSFLITPVLSSSLPQNSHYNHAWWDEMRGLHVQFVSEHLQPAGGILYSYTLMPLPHMNLWIHFVWLFGILSHNNSKEKGISMATDGACGLDTQQRQSASYLDSQTDGIADNWIFPFIDFLSFLVQQCRCQKRQILCYQFLTCFSPC